MARAIERDLPEVIVMPRMPRLMMAMNALFPRLTEKMVVKFNCAAPFATSRRSGRKRRRERQAEEKRMEQPQPDDKNWTWVLERRCPECGFDASAIARRAVGAMLRDNVTAWREALSRGELTRQRPPKAPDGGVIWSALEYGCHVRDVFVLFNERLQLMLTQDDPTFLNWDQDATAIEKRYWEDDHATVLAALQRGGRPPSPTPLTRCATISGRERASAPMGLASALNRLAFTCCMTPCITYGMWPRDSRPSPNRAACRAPPGRPAVISVISRWSNHHISNALLSTTLQ